MAMVLNSKAHNLIKIGCFTFKNGILMGGKFGKKLVYRDSQIFKVRQAYPHTILVKVTPPPWWPEIWPHEMNVNWSRS